MKKTIEIYEHLNQHYSVRTDLENPEAKEILIDAIDKLKAVAKKEADKENSRYNKLFSKDFLTEDEWDKIATEIVKIVAYEEKEFKVDSIVDNGDEGRDVFISNSKTKIRITVNNKMSGINYNYHEEFDYFEAKLLKLINLTNDENVEELMYSKQTTKTK